MNFRQILEGLLTEISAEEIYKKYYNTIDYKIFSEIVLADPKTIEKDGVITNLGKYSKLLLELYKRRKLNLEDLPNAKEYLELIYLHNIPVNSSRINGIPDLYELVKPYVVTKTQTIDDILKALDKSEYKILLNGENWYIIRPLSEKASCYLGVGSTWCTTWGPYSLNKEFRDRTNRFESYNSQGPIYTIINKADNSLKYQIHFENKEYKDKDNREFKTSVFFDEWPEVKHFFFPSLVRDDVSDDVFKLELERLNLISTADVNKILKKYNEKYGESNLIDIISKNDVATLKSLMGEFGEDRDPQITDDEISFSVKKINDEIASVYEKITYYQYDLNNSSEFLYDDISDSFYGSDSYQEIVDVLLNQYYKEHSKKIAIDFGIVDYKSFNKQFLNDLVEDNKFKDKIIDFIVDGARDNFKDKTRAELEYITNKINIEEYSYGYDIKFNKSLFIKFLATSNIMMIDGRQKFILKITEDFIDENDLDYVYERVYDYDYVTPKYDFGSTDSVSLYMEEYFDDLIDEDNVSKECIEARKNFNIIMEKYFNDSSEFENDNVKIRINTAFVDCEDLSVDITYINKESGKVSRGKVKVSNLPRYITNYSLFENKDIKGKTKK